MTSAHFRGFLLHCAGAPPGVVCNALLTRLNHCTTTSRYAQMLHLVLRADNTVWQPNLGFFFFFFVFLLISINREFTLDFSFLVRESAGV